jgi:hypothetical protein
MAGLFCEGFDHQASVSQLIEGKWTAYDAAANKAFVAGRLAGQALRFANSSGNNVSKTLAANYTTLICGFAFRPAIAGTNRIFAFRDAGTDQVGISINGAGRLQIYRGTTSTVLATGTTVLALNTWYYIEIKVTFSNAAGVVELKLDGASEIASTGSLDTTNTANAYANQIVIAAGSNGQYDFDDLYLCDDSGSLNNTFLGVRRVQTVAASGPGSNTQMTPNTGTNHGAVDDTTPDDDTTYVSEDTAGHYDLYAMGDLSGSPSDVAFVQSIIRARVDDAGAASIREKCKSGASTYNGATTHNLGSSYRDYPTIRESDPNTAGSKFTASTFNAAEFGVERVS